jgi:hypothetical protein
LTVFLSLHHAFLFLTEITASPACIKEVCCLSLIHKFPKKSENIFYQLQSILSLADKDSASYLSVDCISCVTGKTFPTTHSITV